MSVRRRLNNILRKIPNRPDEAVLVYRDKDGEPMELISTVHGPWYRDKGDGILPSWFTNPPEEIRRVVHWM